MSNIFYFTEYAILKTISLKKKQTQTTHPPFNKTIIRFIQIIIIKNELFQLKKKKKKLKLQISSLRKIHFKIYLMFFITKKLVRLN